MKTERRELLAKIHEIAIVSPDVDTLPLPVLKLFWVKLQLVLSDKVK